MVIGCHGSDKPAPQESAPITLRDLAPPPDPARAVGLLGNMAVDIHIYNVPTKHQDALRNLWKTLKTRGFRYQSHFAFRANALRVGRISMRQWSWIEGVLQEARAQKERTVSLMVEEQRPADLVIRPITKYTPVEFIDREGDTETARLRPGNLTLRLQAQSNSTGYRLIGFPALALVISERIPELAERMRAKEFAFRTAAFSAPIQLGDVLILGPEEHVGEESTLGGLVFNHPQGVFFMDPYQPSHPKLEPAIRLYVMVCTYLRPLER